jgi:hypothetical protein
VVPTERKDTEIHYPHRRCVGDVAGGFRARAGQAGGASDWAIDITMGRGADASWPPSRTAAPMPWCSRGDLRVRLPALASA